MKNLYFITALFFGTVIYSQTKIIAYKSHSGNMANFSTAISENKFDANFSNLGIRIEPTVENASLDSVIIIDKEKSILVTTNYCKWRATSKQTEKWKPGRDTVYHHNLFSKRNVDSVKAVLKKDYYFKNNMDSVVFVEYDQKKHQYIPLKNKSEKPQKEKKEKSKSGLLLGILMVSSLSGLYSWKRNRKKNEN